MLGIKLIFTLEKSHDILIFEVVKMWKEQIINDIKRTKFNLDNLFVNPITNQYISRNEYIDLVLKDFLIELKKEIKANNSIKILDVLESKIHDNLEYIKFKDYKFNELNCNKSTSNLILSYTYWKYKNPKNDLKSHANMSYIKKMLGFDNIYIEKVIQPIILTTKCYICNGSAIIKIPSYENNRIIFICNDCNHFYETASSTNNNISHFKNTNYVKCSCNLCSHIKKSIYRKGTQWFKDLKNECNKIIQIYSKEVNSLNNLLIETNNKYQINFENLLMSYILGSFNRLNHLTFNEFSNYISSGKFIESYSIVDYDSKNGYIIYDNGFEFVYCENFNIIDIINIDKIKSIIFNLNTHINSYKKLNNLTSNEKDDSEMIQNNFSLELSFATQSSYIFNAINSYGKNIEIHIHIGQCNVIHVTIIVSDRSIMINRDRKFLKYLDTLIGAITMQIYNLTGFLSKGTDIETYFSINFNSIRINFPPCFMSDKDETYKNIERNLSEIVFDKILKFPKLELY